MSDEPVLTGAAVNLKMERVAGSFHSEWTKIPASLLSLCDPLLDEQLGSWGGIWFARRSRLLREKKDEDPEIKSEDEEEWIRERE